MRLILLFLMTLFAVSAHAETTAWAKQEHSQVRMIAGTDNGKLRAAIHLTLDEGWKTYWRTSGDAGLPVSIDTTGSTNLKSAEILWPTPKRYVDFGNLETFAYKHEVILPLRLEVQNPAVSTSLKLKVKFAVCKELCLFAEHTFTLDLSPKKLLSSQEVAQLNKAETTLPLPLNMQTDIKVQSVLLDRDATHVRIEATSETGFDKPDILIEGGPNFRFAEGELTLSEGSKKAVIVAPVQVMLSGQTITDKEVTLTFVDRGKGLEWKTTLIQAGNDKAYNAPYFLLMIGFALLGGFILNFMPCVLPVLSLKVLEILKKSGKEYKVARHSFLASSAGIIFSFFLLAGFVLGLQHAGKTVGWGFQFQEPYFLITLALILTFFAANLFGLFEIHLSHQVSHWMHIKASTKEGYAEHFLTGVFATLMATPCSAPFLGTAIGFAFSQGAFETFTLFLAMGVGMSLPYLVLALFPKLVRHFPKPGPWMVKAKIVFGVMLVATVAWILWILASQRGIATSIVLAILLALIIAAFKVPRKVLRSTLLTLILLCLLLPSVLMKPQEEPIEVGMWQEFDLAKIKTSVEQGKVVVVDVTADWCLTCKANKLLVLDTKEVVALLKMPDTILLKADWTNHDSAISDYLKTFGRYGIPFNAVYGPGAPNGIALPELLSPDKVRKAMEKARGTDKGEAPRPAELP